MVPVAKAVGGTRTLLSIGARLAESRRREPVGCCPIRLLGGGAPSMRQYGPDDELVLGWRALVRN